MNILKTILLLVALVIIASVWRMAPLFNSDYKVSQSYANQCKTVHGVVGAEDITIDQETGLAYLSADDRRNYLTKGTNNATSGAIWVSDLKAENSMPIKIKSDYPEPFHPHGISLLKENDETFLFVVNHVSTTQHQVDIFQITSPTEAILLESISFPELVSPNDVHAVSRQSFFITNDHSAPRQTLSEKLEDSFRLAVTNVLLYQNGEVSEVIDGLSMANGITLDAEKTHLYVAETTGERIAVFQRGESLQDWSLKSTFDLNVLVDNLEWDEHGHLLVGSHPKALDFLIHTFKADKLAPSIAHRINVETGEFEILYEDDGSNLSGSSVAAAYQDQLLVGPVFEAHYIHCKGLLASK